MKRLFMGEAYRLYWLQYIDYFTSAQNRFNEVMRSMFFKILPLRLFCLIN
ncbi:MAG: hypothetical protein LBJ00_16965 [Planctomycetaceae bacterium]|nr:hypothetical protein [Planctomycetaceae bacterium]